MKTIKRVYPKAKCPICNKKFDLTRTNKTYCSRNCQKNAASKTKPTKPVRVRTVEYRVRNRDHYERAMWLTYDTYRLPEPERSIMYQKLLEAASNDDAKIRNILLDPKLLGAGKWDLSGRSVHDCKIGVSNIAKQVYQFCMANYGCGTKDCIMDGGKPAKRFFVGDPVVDNSKPYEACEPSKKHLNILKKLNGLSRQAYFNMLVVEQEQALFDVQIAA